MKTKRASTANASEITEADFFTEITKNSVFDNAVKVMANSTATLLPQYKQECIERKKLRVQAENSASHDLRQINSFSPQPLQRWQSGIIASF